MRVLATIGPHGPPAAHRVRFPLEIARRQAHVRCMFDARACYEAMRRRDPGADGLFFVGVRTTGIYCRPICPARLPLFRNIRFYPTAAQAQAAGFRPCLRCRPESAPDSPAWLGSLASINRALRLIDEGALVDAGVAALARRLGMTDRHLRRLFVRHLGVGPLTIEQTRRIHLAKKLVHETRLSMTDIAFASGFGSLRRFNEIFQTMFARPPSTLRRLPKARDGDAAIALTLSYRPPLRWRTRAARALAQGARQNGGGLVLPLPLEPGAQVALSPARGNTLRAAYTRVPIRQLGRAISLTKRLVLSDIDAEP